MNKIFNQNLLLIIKLALVLVGVFVGKIKNYTRKEVFEIAVQIYQVTIKNNTAQPVFESNPIGSPV
jgi:hypothetical protein